MTRFVKIAFWCFFLLLLTGCRDAPSQAHLAPNGVILAFGDSLTYGTGAARSEAYPAVLSGLVGRKVINAGVPGEVSAEGLARLPAVLQQHRPALVILCHGGNDFLRRLGKAELAQNLRKMIELCQQSGAQVALVGVPHLGIFLSTDPLYEELAREYRLPFEGEVLSELLSDRSVKSDQIHPNAAGYGILAERIAGLIAGPAGL